jgi:hypothetical protein
MFSYPFATAIDGLIWVWPPLMVSRSPRISLLSSYERTSSSEVNQLGNAHINGPQGKGPNEPTSSCNYAFSCSRFLWKGNVNRPAS